MNHSIRTETFAQARTTLRFHACLAGMLAVLLGNAGLAAEPKDTPTWKAGAASIDITPEGPVWMAGFASRNKPSEGVAQPIHAKALAVQDTGGARLVIVTLDLSTVPKRLRQSVERQAGEKYRLPPDSLLINASHSHSGPSMYAGMGLRDPVYLAKAEAYGQRVESKVVEVIGNALAQLESATLTYSHARAGFAMNRRLPVGNQVRNSPNPDGPVDHDVPVLWVTGADGKVKAILFGYACHNTVTPFYKINGDYAGYAQAYLEQKRPGVIALFMQGAGGDQNPYPRDISLEQSEQHGRSLGYAVEAAMQVLTSRTVHGPLQSALGYVELEYAQSSRADLERRATSRNAVEKSRAEALLKQLDSDGKLPASYPCPVQVVKFGTDITLVAIGGEATVEYSLRLKREMASQGPAVWVAGYSNEVFGYLGSRRVILEGGYEGYSANLGRHPGPWATNTEDRVIGKAYELIQALNH